MKCCRFIACVQSAPDHQPKIALSSGGWRNLDRLSLCAVRPESVDMLLSAGIHLAVAGIAIKRNNLRYLVHDLGGRLVADPDLARLQTLHESCAQFTENTPPLPRFALRRRGRIHPQHPAVGTRGGALLAPGRGVGESDVGR